MADMGMVAWEEVEDVAVELGAHSVICSVFSSEVWENLMIIELGPCLPLLVINFSLENKS